MNNKHGNRTSIGKIGFIYTDTLAFAFAFTLAINMTVKMDKWNLCIK